jgi:hypothetical protein
VTETFYGEWSVLVLSKEAWFDERFVIAGSDSSDGAYPGVAGSGPGPVSGAEWTLTMQWNDNSGSGWQPSGLRRWVSYTVQDGLVVTIGADDNYEHLRDGDFNDCVLTCRSLDPAHTPLHPIVNPYDFTLPKDVLERYHRKHDRDGERERDPGKHPGKDAEADADAEKERRRQLELERRRQLEQGGGDDKPDRVEPRRPEG